MAIDPRMVKWDDEEEAPAIDPKMVKWDKGTDWSNVKTGSTTVKARTKKEYAGLAGRSVAQGAAGTLDMINTGMKMFPGTSLFSMATQGLPSIRDATNVALTNVGAPRPRTANERVGSDIGEAATGAALTMGGGYAAGSRFLTANPYLQGMGAVTGAGAMGATREAGGGPLLQTAAALAGGLTPAAIRAGVPMAVRGGFRGGEAGRQTVEQNIADFRMAGTTPTVGQATQRWMPRAVESLLGRLPGGAGVIARKAQAQGEEIGAGVRGMADQLAPGADAESAGRAIRQGVVGPGGFQERTRAAGGLLYDNLDQHIDDASRVGVNQTSGVLDEINPEIPGAPNLTPFFQNARLGGIKAGFDADANGTGSLMTRPGAAEWTNDMRTALQAQADEIARQNVLRTSSGQRPLPVPSAADIDAHVQGQLAGQVDGRLPYEAVRKTRTMVGNEVANANFASDVPLADWKRLYGGLSDDMRTASEVAGPEAQRAFTRANGYHRAVQNRSETIKHVVNQDTPEKIFAAATQGTKEGATTLRALMRSLPEGSQKQVAAAVLNRMGRALDGQQNADGTAFSTKTFLTNWSKLSKEAQSALFDRLGPEFQKQVAAVTRTTDNLNQGSKVYSNPSGTAAASAQLFGVGSLATAGATMNAPAVGGLLTGMGVANLAARGMTSKSMPAWLAKRTEIPYGAVVPQGFLSSYLEDQEEKRKAKGRNK